MLRLVAQRVVRYRRACVTASAFVGCSNWLKSNPCRKRVLWEKRSKQSTPFFSVLKKTRVGNCIEDTISAKR